VKAPSKDSWINCAWTQWKRHPKILG